MNLWGDGLGKFGFVSAAYTKHDGEFLVQLRWAEKHLFLFPLQLFSFPFLITSLSIAL